MAELKWKRLIWIGLLVLTIVNPIYHTMRYTYIYDLPEQEALEHLGDAYNSGIEKNGKESFLSYIRLTGAYEAGAIELEHDAEYRAIAKPIWGKIKLALVSEEGKIILFADLSKKPYSLKLEPGIYRVCYIGKLFWGRVSLLEAKADGRIA